MAAQPDFWGVIEKSVSRTPVAILREQASLLSAKTGNLLEGQVKTTVRGAGLDHSFRLIAPALDGYNYELFTVSHEVSSVYPLCDPNEYDVPYFENEVEFTAWLREKLSSPETKRVLSTLLAQVTT